MISPPGEGRRLSSSLLVTLCLTGGIGIAAPALLVAYTPTPSTQPARSHQAVTPVSAPIVPPTVLPPVEPVAIKELTPDEARAYNASVPFAGGAIAPARPFRFAGSEEDRERATDCLATAALYEAGDDTAGEKAVAQVVLNRVRHPAFPDTVCGVIFQGAERTSGCQFTFTCDGAMAHSWSQAAWKRAQDVAAQALAGSVDQTVGNATHYHTDWVVPYWSASLDKIAAVGSHLFFRWTGWWGTTPAFRMRYRGGEPRIAQLADRFDSHKSAEALADASHGTVDAATIAQAALPQPTPGDADLFLVSLDQRLDPATLRALAERACASRDYCKFMAWREDDATPDALPLSPAALSAMAFSYLRDRKRGFEKALWNCRTFPQANGDQCMNRVARSLPSKSRDFGLEKLPGSTTSHQAGAVPSGLSGVRRKPDDAATPEASPAPATRGVTGVGKR
ncbi:cell wall hydrolase [Stakelama sp. CBK3Z-3]|uniref:Cell wall hydrolase n=1 Tax=Stakelama flava TaxID=2860338 RepID=A0ABS6XLQ3_9SPHN|nr:cell wall hydrolase [Stakelama flava]MBW4330844.1 cell wall hydrolase [Stakelama flava]